MVSLSDKVVVDPVRPEDVNDIYRIAREEGLPPAWVWPDGLPGTAARIDGRVVAFCILKETVYGLVVEELWREKTRYGIIGLFALGDWIESLGQRLADERGVPLAVGGIIRLELAEHDAALARRGFNVIANVREKIYLPKNGVSV